MAGNSDQWLEDWADPEDLLHLDRKPCLAERKIWSAVIELAVRDAKGEVRREHDDESSFFRGRRVVWAKAWLSWPGHEPGSYLWILSALNMREKASAIRKAAGL